MKPSNKICYIYIAISLKAFLHLKRKHVSATPSFKILKYTAYSDRDEEEEEEEEE